MKTKKWMLTLGLMCTLLPYVQAQQSVNTLFQGYAKVEGAERVELDKMPMGTVNLFQDVMGGQCN